MAAIYPLSTLMNEVTKPDAYYVPNYEATVIAPDEEVSDGRHHCMEKWLTNVQLITLEAFISYVDDDEPAGGICPNLSWFGPDDTECKRDARTILGVAGRIVSVRNEALIIKMKPPDIKCYHRYRRGGHLPMSWTPK